MLKLLYEQRHVAASGHETTDTDPGLAVTKDDYSLESYLLGTNHYQIELPREPRSAARSRRVDHGELPQAGRRHGVSRSGCGDPAMSAGLVEYAGRCRNQVRAVYDDIMKTRGTD